ncbi:major facilitator family transporter [Legionella lansingensis]|uniref:Major facilitator family transporter n=1 Tax=Legionella lansingensis TaxID=45067 RepID=A0A0W0VLL5_9GAMM|nr:MFS transporter [Legionella lansingensis]KTD20980.1 major facilitator family transporter [Legionella lansingensis]SNV44709.1 major facilitator family transporter [Legionella lansingensis]
MTKKQYNIVKLTALGGTLEFYDFTIYALFAPFLSHHFFANTNPMVGLINTFAVFALGYLARPLGGIFFGHLGDRYGRKSAFSLAVFMMAVATLLMGCLPSSQSMGIVPSLILIGLRLVQGFSVGGEIPGAVVFILEHIPKTRHGFSIGLVFMCITLGNTLGAGVGLLLTTILNQQQMMAWGWRIPFILGFLLGIISYVIRRKAMETPVFIAMKQEEKIYHVPILQLLKSSRKKLLTGFLLTAVPASIISLFLYLPTYLTSIAKMEISYAYWINFISFLSFALMTSLFGRVSDYVSRKKLLTVGALGLLLLSYFLFYQLTVCGEWFIWVFVLGFSVLGGMINGSYAVLLAQSFSGPIRYSGVGFSYSLGIALFGGVAPLVFTWFIHFFNLIEAPAFYLLGCAAITLTAVGCYKLGSSLDPNVA